MLHLFMQSDLEAGGWGGWSLTLKSPVTLGLGYKSTDG